MENVFSKGELTVQQLAGESQMAARVGRIIGETISPQAIPFLEDQIILLATSQDLEGNLWVSFLTGELQFHQESITDLAHSGHTGRFWLFKIKQ